jgi:hypothetical protein
VGTVGLRRWICSLAVATAAATPGARADDAPPPRRLEMAAVPLLGGDTDIGFGGGGLGSIARVDPAYLPYRWKLEGTLFFTFKAPAGGGVTAPYQDAFVILTVTSLCGGRCRLELRPSFTRETNLRYLGLGNAAPAPPNEIPARDFYTRTHPALVARGRYSLAAHLHLVVGALYTYSWIDFSPVSILARDLREGSPEVRSLLIVDRRAGLNVLEAGLQLDTRDQEIAPERGQWHQLKVRVSPWGLAFSPYRYTQLNLNMRGYVPALPQRLVLAARLVADLQLGGPPFYELARYDEASAIGGANGVRGVPGDRYYGKRKLFGNLEARLALWRFSVWGSPYRFGVTGFFDGGRVWADLESQPQLDGTGIGLKYGVGGGLRLQKGETFVLRADIAWSPDAHPIGGYFLAGQMF